MLPLMPGLAEKFMPGLLQLFPRRKRRQYEKVALWSGGILLSQMGGEYNQKGTSAGIPKQIAFDREVVWVLEPS
jgi:hypothetical protein